MAEQNLFSNAVILIFTNIHVLILSIKKAPKGLNTDAVVIDYICPYTIENILISLNNSKLKFLSFVIR